MKSYGFCSLVLFQIVSVHGVLQLNVLEFGAEHRGYIGCSAGNTVRYTDLQRNRPVLKVAGQQFFWAGLAQNGNQIFNIPIVSAHNSVLNRSPEDLHKLLFFRNPTLVLDKDH